MRAAIIENGKVDNIVEVPSLDFAESRGWVACSSVDRVVIGDNYTSTTGKFSAPVESAPNPEPVPEEISAVKARIQLQREGLLAQVEAFMADPGTSAETVLAWKHAQTFRRQSPVLKDVARLFNLSAGQVDQMFKKAAKIDI